MYHPDKHRDPKRKQVSCVVYLESAVEGMEEGGQLKLLFEKWYGFKGKNGKI